MSKEPQTPPAIEILTRKELSSILEFSEENISKLTSRPENPMPRIKSDDHDEQFNLDEVIGWLRKAAEPDAPALCNNRRPPKQRELGRF